MAAAKRGATVIAMTVLRAAVVVGIGCYLYRVCCVLPMSVFAVVTGEARQH